MNTNVRIEMTDEEKKKWKETFGENPTRKNIKSRVVKMVAKALDSEASEEDEDDDEEKSKKKEKPKKKKVFRLGSGRK